MRSSDTIHVGEIEVRTHERVVLVDGRETPLTTREFGIVRALAEHPGWVYSADELCEDPEDGEYSPESVSVLVSRLRHKLADAGAPDVIETVRGAGYRMHPSAERRDTEDEAEAARVQLRDASWQLQEAILEVDHSGSPDQQHAACDALDEARRKLYSSLAE